ncbi:MAG: murein biosynthesis integral membrane protein MurJ [Caulobacterales bacterium 68-7]|nr:MAG: murein biosynthesis integral membrane protein MurJ [Caulobacterales bacterium 68-7]
MTDTPPAPTSPPDPPASVAAKRSGLLRSSLIFSSFTLLSRFMGFARDLVITARIGASGTIAADAYYTALAFPNLFRRIFAEGAFSSAFVPAYAKALARDGEDEADILASDALATLAMSTLVLMVVAQLTMPWLMLAFRSGFVDTPDKFALTVTLTQITMAYLPCMSIYAHLSGVLNARNRFILSGAAPILLNLWMLALVLPAKTPVQGAYFASIGVVIAGISQAALLVWGCNRSGAKVHWRLPRLTPPVKALIMAAVPGALAASASQINVWVSGTLVSHVDGAVSWLSVCDRLYQLPQGLVGVAIGVALLPQLTRAVMSGDKTESTRTLDEATIFAMALTLPAAAALIIMPYFLIDGLFTRGEFTSFDARQTAQALLQYGWGVPAFVLAQITNRAFFANHDTRTPMIVALVSVAVNIAAGVTLFHLIGVPGVAAATSLASWVNVIVMSVILHRRGLYSPDRKAVSRLIRLVFASLALAALLAFAAYRQEALKALLSKEVAILLVSASAALVYPVLLIASGGLTVAEIKSALRRKKGAAPALPEA